MRMARLKVVTGELIASPDRIAISNPFDLNEIGVWVIGTPDTWALAMPLDEAIEEINAAMTHGSGIPEGYGIMYIKNESPIKWDIEK